MFANVLSMFKKRPRLDEVFTSGATTSETRSVRAHNDNNNIGQDINDSNGDEMSTSGFIPAVCLCSSIVNTSCTDRPLNLNERFVTVLDQLDARVEKFRRDALGLQEKRDFLNMSVDLIKSNELMQSLSESEREEITCYIQRVNSRLSTVELNVRTVRDTSQEDSLSQINEFIDMMITLGDPALSRQRCQMYLNACCSAGEAGGYKSSTEYFGSSVKDMDAGPIDKKFESVLLGCTLDDQKNIKRRLHALMGYLNKQIIHQ